MARVAVGSTNTAGSSGAATAGCDHLTTAAGR
jgi:hypothetical protein